MDPAIAPPAPLARHPIRRLVMANQDARTVAMPMREEDDLKLFALSFTAFFICIYTLIF